MLRRHAPWLLDAEPGARRVPLARPTAPPPPFALPDIAAPVRMVRGVLVPEVSPAPDDRADVPSLPLIQRFLDSDAYREDQRNGPIIRRVFVGIIAFLIALVAADGFGFVALPGPWRVVQAIAAFPFPLDGLAFLVSGAALLFSAWLLFAMAHAFRKDEDWGIEFRADGVVFLDGATDRLLVPWSGIARIERLPLVDVDQFVLVTPLKVKGARRRTAKIGEIAFGWFDPNWRRGPIGDRIRAHAPHLLDPIATAILDADRRRAAQQRTGGPAPTIVAPK